MDQISYQLHASKIGRVVSALPRSKSRGVCFVISVRINRAFYTKGQLILLPLRSKG